MFLTREGDSNLGGVCQQSIIGPLSILGAASPEVSPHPPCVIQLVKPSITPSQVLLSTVRILTGPQTHAHSPPDYNYNHRFHTGQLRGLLSEGGVTPDESRRFPLETSIPLPLGLPASSIA